MIDRIEREPTIPERLKGSKSFIRDFSLIAQLSERQLEGLHKIGESPDGFDVQESSLKDIASSLELKEKELNTILKVTRYIYLRTLNENIDAERAVDDICKFVKEKIKKDIDDKKPCWLKIFKPKKNYDFKILNAVMDVNKTQKTVLVPKIKDYYNGDIKGQWP